MSPSDLNREDGLKVFFVSFSDINGRFDPLYYYSVNNLSIVNRTRYPVKKLSEVITMQRGRFGHRPRNEPRFYGGEYPFIQTGDIVRASKTNGHITFSQTLNELGLKTSRLFSKPVVVITIAANIGDTAILDYPACFPDSLIGMTPKTNELLLEYINLYFKFIKTYLEDLAPQSAQKNINYQQLAPIPIVVPPLDIQQRAVQIYQAAIIQRQQKEQQSQAILAGINVYLLAELGIILPKQDNTFTKRIFKSNFSELIGQRFDPSWYFNSHYRIEGGQFPNFSLGEIAFINKGQSITSAQIEDGLYPVVAGGQSSPYKHHIFNHNGNVITISASGAYAGYVWYHEAPIFASDCSVVTSKNEDNVKTIFLAEILKFKQKEIYYLQQGAGQPHVYPRDLMHLKIPVPPRNIQLEILRQIDSIRIHAKQLQSEAVQIVVDAKAEVERIILGE
jgi:type I restriction enzyme, S subunit